MTRLFLARHGRAASASEDPNRGLTPEGIEELQRLVRFLKQLDFTAAAIEHSGKTRALQTAQILCGTAGSDARLKVNPDLAPDADPLSMSTYLDAADDHTLAVGHLPNLELVTSRLLMGRDDLCPVRFSTGTVVCLERADKGAWLLTWAISPAELPKMP